MDTHREREAFAAQFKLTLAEYLRIVRCCNTLQTITVLELMKSSKHKSSYRNRMHLQIRRWLDNNMPGPPLSESQFKACCPTWPIFYDLPK
jgi:hypothetical protein